MTKNSLFTLAGLASMFDPGSPITQDSASAKSDTDQDTIDKRNASRSQRQMRIDRGQHTVAIGARRIERNRLRSVKAKNRYQNNLDSSGVIQRSYR